MKPARPAPRLLRHLVGGEELGRLLADFFKNSSTVLAIGCLTA